MVPSYFSKGFIPVHTLIAQFLADTLQTTLKDVTPASRGCWSFRMLAESVPTHATWKFTVTNIPPGEGEVLSCTEFLTKTVLR